MFGPRQFDRPSYGPQQIPLVASDNKIRNPRCEGAVPGTPGTAPTNWSISANNGLIISIVASGYEAGIPYTAVRVAGTATAASSFTVLTESKTQIAAMLGQVWTTSVYLRLTDGSLVGANYSIIQIAEYNASGGFVTNTTKSVNPSNASLASGRVECTTTITNAATAFVTSGFSAQFPAGATVDFTLRIGLPQMEQQPFASSLVFPPVGMFPRN